MKKELENKPNIDPDEIVKLRNKNVKLKVALDKLQQDFRNQAEIGEKDLDNVREENRILLTKIKTMEAQVEFAVSIHRHC